MLMTKILEPENYWYKGAKESKITAECPQLALSGSLKIIIMQYV
jgi:hypothetical protein